MRVVSRVKESGDYLEDVLVAGDGGLPPDCVESRPTEGLHAPRWTGSAWTEGRPQAEILTAAKAQKRSEMAQAFVQSNTALYPEAPPEYAIWLAVPEYAATPNGQRPQSVRANIARLRERLTSVERAATVAAVGAVMW